MKKIFLAVLALSMAVSAADDKSIGERVDDLQAQIDGIMAKAGIQFSGEFRSQFLSSTVDGDAVAENQKKREGVEYTSVDFDITARPNTALSARAVFRLHQDWRNFFSDVQNPITTRWLSIDGALLDGIIKFNIGDYHKKLTPLTLWAPELGLLYEPEIFKQNRDLAMAEAGVVGNDRALQGLNVGFKAELYPIVKEIELDAFAARLATRGTGESAVVPPGVTNTANGVYWDANYDKYLIGANLGVQVIEGAGLGVSNILIYDHLESYNSNDSIAKLNLSPYPVGLRAPAQWTNVMAARLNADTRAFMPDDFINVGLRGEFAMSTDKIYYLKETRNPENQAEVLSSAVSDSTIDGTAINAGLTAKINLSEGNTISLSADYIMNDKEFRNDAAQSPTFVQRGIMNNENGMGGLGVMNPFDAMYRSVFKYTPSQYFGDIRARPYTKNSYTNSILTAEQRGQISPNVFQAALPGGMATADRAGIVSKVRGSFLEDGITVGLNLASLTSAEDVELAYGYFDENFGEYGGFRDVKIPAYSTEYLEVVAGASVDIAKFVPVVGPSLEISGSYGIYNTTGVVGVVETENVSTMDTESSILSIGLNYQFAQRFSVLFGYQMFEMTSKGMFYADNDKVEIPEAKYTFDNMSFGFGYKVADGGVLTAKLTLVNGEGPEQFEDVEGGGRRSLGRPKYDAFQPEVYLTVKF